ncbi:MAG TPA: MOSC domain-containing protein [Propionibacterium sp.]|nr:MOSC domain-containing protein [Propionibacterium sp.]
MILDAVRVGGLRPLPREGQRTGMYKVPVQGPVHVGRLGLAGDRQGDPTVHGGPDKAVHLYPSDHYPVLAERRPDLAHLLVPGVLGENLSVRGLDEAGVCLGDTWAAGGVRLQVSQPRRPCWKIDHRLDTDGMVALVNELRRPGWYFRVVEEGELQAGDDFVLVDRPAPDLTVRGLLETYAEHRPDPDDLRRYALAPGLPAGWVDRLTRRATWLDSLR